MHLPEPRAERELRVHSVDSGDVRVGDERDLAAIGHELAEATKRASLDVHACGCENTSSASRTVKSAAWA